MRYKGVIYLDHLERAWLRLPGQREPMLLEPAQSLLIHEMIHPFAVQYQRALYMRGYVTTLGGQLRPSILRSH